MRFVLLLAFILMLSQSYGEVTVTGKMEKKSDRAEHLDIESDRANRLKRPVRQYYYTTVISNCEKYIEIIEKRDQEIAALKEELYRLRSVEQAELRKELKKEYELEMQKFDERGNHTKTVQ